MNRIFRFSNFDDGPHWDTALIEAESEEQAREKMRAIIAASEADHANYGPRHIDTLWQPEAEAGWRVEVEDEPLVFVLGAGCRG